MSKEKAFKMIKYLIVFLFKGKPYLKEKISENYIVPIEKLNFNKACLTILNI